MDNFHFHNPVKILFGKNTIQQIGVVLSEYNIKKVLILFGQSSVKKHGYFNTIAAKLIEKEIEFVEFGDIPSNPTVSIVNKAIEISKINAVDAVLAVGGGSVIDTAKTVAVGHYYNGNIWDVFEKKTQITKALPIFTILTASATASEMNPIAVITNEDENKKWSFAAGEFSTPKVSIVDPVLQFTLPPKQTVNGAVDSITHVLEYYFNGVKNVDVQDEISEGIIRTIIKHIRILLKNPHDYESRAQLAWCSTLAFNGLNAVGRFGGDFSTHSIEHTLSALYPNIHHAEGLAVILPNWMNYVFMADLEKFTKISTKIFNINGNNDRYLALEGINAIRKLFDELNAPSQLRIFGIKKEDLEHIADLVVLNGPIGRLKRLEKVDVLEILEMSY